MNVPLLIAFGIGLALNLYASFAVWRSTLYAPPQKQLQFGMIWLVPLLGAILTIYLAREPKPAKRSPSYPADGYADDGDLRLDNYSSAETAGDSGGGGDGGGGD